jgi:hypothetical protein
MNATIGIHTWSNKGSPLCMFIVIMKGLHNKLVLNNRKLQTKFKSWLNWLTKRPRNFSSKRKSFERICLAVNNDYVNFFLTLIKLIKWVNTFSIRQLAVTRVTGLEHKSQDLLKWLILCCKDRPSWKELWVQSEQKRLKMLLNLLQMEKSSSNGMLKLEIVRL